MLSSLRYASAAVGANLRSAMEYRAAFVMQAGFMLANNLLFLAFWAIFFARFETVRGWRLEDVALLFAVAACSFGLAVVSAGGVLTLAARIAEGRLDAWLLRPRPVFLQAAVSRSWVAGFGDVATGVLLLFASGNGQPARVAAFAVACPLAACALLAFAFACHSTAFFLGRAEELAQQAVHALLTFAMEPPPLFSGATRLLLYLVVPAGVVAWTPAELVRSWSWSRAGWLGLGVAALVGLAAVLWRAGLARYESGNLTQAAEQ